MTNYIGIMSGTSLDGVDVVWVQYRGSEPKFCAGKTYALPAQLKKQITDMINLREGSWLSMGALDRQFGELFADCVATFCTEVGLSLEAVTAVGLPGQTFWHEPGHFSLQIGDANILKARLGCPIVADFRRADVARGGQGAPLAPVIHELVLPKGDILVNIGGIANISYWQGDHICGFDTGPGNGLIDAAAEARLGMAYDKGGATAKLGQVIPGLLEDMLKFPYFQQPAPKTTGKETFNAEWLKAFASDFSDEDYLMTLTALTARTIVDHLPFSGKLWVTGGGVHNEVLMQLLAEYHSAPVASIQVLGVEPDFLEAMLFAHLAQCRVENRPISLMNVTGAREPTLLGAIY